MSKENKEICKILVIVFIIKKSKIQKNLFSKNPKR